MMGWSFPVIWVKLQTLGSVNMLIRRYCWHIVVGHSVLSPTKGVCACEWSGWKSSKSPCKNNGMLSFVLLLMNRFTLSWQTRKLYELLANLGNALSPPPPSPPSIFVHILCLTFRFRTEFHSLQDKYIGKISVFECNNIYSSVNFVILSDTGGKVLFPHLYKHGRRRSQISNAEFSSKLA